MRNNLIQGFKCCLRFSPFQPLLNWGGEAQEEGDFPWNIILTESFFFNLADFIIASFFDKYTGGLKGIFKITSRKIG